MQTRHLCGQNADKNAKNRKTAHFMRTRANQLPYSRLTSKQKGAEAPTFQNHLPLKYI